MSQSSPNGERGKHRRHIILTVDITTYNNSIDCLKSAVHWSAMAGICGNIKDGVYSVALSSSYKDDEDGGDVMYEYLFHNALSVSDYRQHLYWHRW